MSIASKRAHGATRPAGKKSVSIGVNPWLKLLREFGLGKIVRGGVG
jgi:hypothetical protein